MTSFVSDLSFFCEQKTSYDMRSRDWSSDVSSSDLPDSLAPGTAAERSNGLAGRRAPRPVATAPRELTVGIWALKYSMPPCCPCPFEAWKRLSPSANRARRPLETAIVLAPAPGRIGQPTFSTGVPYNVRLFY